jgi:ribosomal protein S12 methylthiotransferase
MHSNPKKNIRFNVFTFGCAKNTYDSEVLLTQLHHNGFPIIHEAELSPNDIVIINTCGFINDAKQESINAILEFAEAKNDEKIKGVYVFGCLSERYKEELANEIPEVDAFFGVYSLNEILDHLKLEYKKHLVGQRVLTTPSHYAYLKIADGCNQKCSFCAIPGIKGSYQSVPVEELVSQAEMLVEHGVREIILIAQDTTYYGLDLYGKRKLADLLNALADIPDLQWLRLQYTFPAKFPEDVLETISKRKNICNYIDIPLQHISNNLLGKMKRGINKSKTKALLEQIKATIPGVAIRTTFICGYPGETEADFDELYEFVKEMQFDRMGVFTYSHEENTAAYKQNDDIPEVLKEERANILMSLQRNISLQKNQQKTGQFLEVMIDRMEGENYIGRTEFDSPEVDNEVIVDSATPLNPGEIYRVKITSASDYDLIATFEN